MYFAGANKFSSLKSFVIRVSVGFVSIVGQVKSSLSQGSLCVLSLVCHYSDFQAEVIELVFSSLYITESARFGGDNCEAMV